MWLHLIIVISISYHLSKSHIVDLVCSKKPSCNLVIIPFLTSKSSYLVDDHHQPIKQSLKCFTLEHDKFLQLSFQKLNLPELCLVVSFMRYLESIPNILGNLKTIHFVELFLTQTCKNDACGLSIAVQIKHHLR